MWWGENLAGAKQQPVHLSDQSKLVYTPHTYGPGVYMQGYFKAANFPHNMAAVWDSHFAFVQQATGQPVVIGEMGGVYTGKDHSRFTCAQPQCACSAHCTSHATAMGVRQARTGSGRTGRSPR